MRTSTSFVDPRVALPGRSESVTIDRLHLTLGTSLHAPFPTGTEVAYFGMGCFWGAERLFYELEGVVVTAVGYQGGVTPNPTYQEVCSGRTNHTEIVQVVFDPATVTFRSLTQVFFENHDPTQGMRQGGDIGTQYRSAIYYVGDSQREAAESTAALYGAAIAAQGYGPITTSIQSAEGHEFWLAEEYHQRYLEKNPNGYDCHSSTGVAFPSERISS